MQPTFNIYPLLVWLSGIGVSHTLVLAVLFVKLARVYRIFYQYTQLGPLCSNMALAIYALALCSPSVVILTIMTSIKTFKWSIKTKRHSDYVEVLYVCQGDLDSYYTALSLYMVLLTLAVVTVAIKTRKLRLKNFKDTKTVNVFSCALIISEIFGYVFYKISHDLSLYVQANIVLHIFHCNYIGLCLGFLFTSKLFLVAYTRYFEKTNAL